MDNTPDEIEQVLRSLRQRFDHSQYVYTVDMGDGTFKFLLPGSCGCGGRSTSYISTLTYDIAVATNNEMFRGCVYIKGYASPQALLNELTRTLHPDKDIQLWETRL